MRKVIAVLAAILVLLIVLINTMVESIIEHSYPQTKFTEAFAGLFLAVKEFLRGIFTTID